MGDACCEKLQDDAQSSVQEREDDERIARRLRFLQMAGWDLSPALRFIHQLAMLEMAVKWVCSGPRGSVSSSDTTAMDAARFRAVTHESLFAMAERSDLPEHMRASLAVARSAWLSEEYQCCADALEELRMHCTQVLHDIGGR